MKISLFALVLSFGIQSFADVASVCFSSERPRPTWSEISIIEYNGAIVFDGYIRGRKPTKITLEKLRTEEDGVVFGGWIDEQSHLSIKLEDTPTYIASSIFEMDVMFEATNLKATKSFRYLCRKQ